MEFSNDTSKIISENIKVFTRLRPDIKPITDEDFDDCSKNNNEVNSKSGGITSFTDNNLIYKNTNNSNLEFGFTKVFSPSANQNDLYLEAAQPIVQSAIHGYSGTIFAYGPTGSGKTYTMRGNKENPGIIYRCLEELLVKSHGITKIAVSYLQIYCETIHDLLKPINNEQLSIRQNTNGSVFVDGISSIIVESIDDLNNLLEVGDNNRTTAATSKNATSSRSHAALMIKLLIPDGINNNVNSNSNSKDNKERHPQGRESHLILVDLAGSERYSVSEGRYLRLEEAKSINLSLSALGNCMSALSENRPHIPYRDSKLTRLLQGSLGGGSRTSVIVNLAYNEDASGEILNALRFSARASKVAVVSKVSRYIDYEALYNAAQKELDAKNDQLISSEQALSTCENELEKKKALLEKSQQELSFLKDHLNLMNIKQQQDNNSNSKIPEEKENFDNSKEEISSSSLDIDIKQAQEGFDKQLSQLTEKYMEAMSSQRSEWTRKVDVVKRQLAESTAELRNEQSALQAEREMHLKTVQELSAAKRSLRDAESLLNERMSENLEEIDEKRQAIEELELSVKEEKKEIEANKLEVAAMREEMSTMVSKDQIADMERLFNETVTMLTSRMSTLEVTSPNAKDMGDDDDEWSLGSPTRNPNPGVANNNGRSNARQMNNNGGRGLGVGGRGTGQVGRVRNLRR